MLSKEAATVRLRECDEIEISIRGPIPKYIS